MPTHPSLITPARYFFRLAPAVKGAVFVADNPQRPGRDALSYRDVEEMMTERGLSIVHTTIYRWVQSNAPEIDNRCRTYLKQTNDSWRVDETYVKVRGQ